MKLKRNAASILFLGILIVILGAMTPIVYTAHNGAAGIVGGSDAPTYRFMLSELFDGLPLVLVLLGVSLIVSSGFCLLFSKTVSKHCNIKTSAVSLGLSGVGALGLVCAFIWLTIVTFGKMASHPIEYPVSIILGMACFFTFLALIAVYFKVRIMHWSMIGVLIDILTSVIYLPAFFFGLAYLSEIIT